MVYFNSNLGATLVAGIVGEGLSRRGEETYHQLPWVNLGIQ